MKLSHYSLSILLSISLMSCALENKSDSEDEAGIMITGNTITVGQDTLQVEYDSKKSDTAQFFSHIRMAHSIPKNQNLDQILTGKDPVLVAWDFKNFNKLGQQENSSNGQVVKYVGPPQWSSLENGVIFTDSNSILSIDHNDLQNSDSLSIALQVFQKNRSHSSVLLTKGDLLDTLGGFSLTLDSLGRLQGQFKNPKEVKISIQSQDSIKLNQWSKVELQKLDGQVQILLNGNVVAKGFISAQKNQSKAQLLISGEYSLSQIDTKKSFSGLIDYLAFIKKSDMVLADSMIDARDGKIYKTVRIGTQTWMAENLNYNANDNLSWCYNNSDTSCVKYGRLYTWSAAQTQCPAGWHLATDAEWQTLETNIGMLPSEVQSLNWRGSMGVKLRNTSAGGTDDYGFGAVLGGTRREDGSFTQVTTHGQYWTGTSIDANFAWYRDFSSYAGIYRMDQTDGYGKLNAMAVRCMHN